MNHRSAGVRQHAVALEGRKNYYYSFFFAFLWGFKDLMRQVISFLGGHFCCLVTFSNKQHEQSE